MSKFNFNIDNIENNEKQSSLSKSKNNSITLKELYELNLYVVDLGLPSGTLWCKYNLGVDSNKLSKPEDWYGDYYAWGETEAKSIIYSWETYQFKEDLFKYNKKDHLTKLQSMDDPVYLNMHLYNFKFKMPTKELFLELKETNNEWVENFNNSGVNGYKFTNKSDSSKYIFLPAAGYCDDSDLSYIGAGGYYWSSSLNTITPVFAWNLYFDNEEAGICFNDRYAGFSVRPVINL